MKLAKAWENRDYFSGKASEITRQLSFSGIAVVWIFKTTTAVTAQIPGDLILPLFLLVLTLALDFGQYLAGSLEWQVFTRHQEGKHSATDADDVIDDSPDWLNLPHEICFWLKLVTLLLGYILLVVALGTRL